MKLCFESILKIVNLIMGLFRKLMDEGLLEDLM